RNVTRDTWAIYIQDIWDVTEDLNFTLGVRHDQYDDFGGATSPRAAIVWHVQTNWDIKLLYGEAFRAPTFNELYFMNNPSRIGNPDMDAERMRTYEASVGYNISTFSARLTYFNNTITNNIRQMLVPGTRAALKFENSGGANVNGIEAEMMAELMTGVILYANYTHQRAEDKDTDKKLPDVADHKGNVGFNALLLGKLNVNMNVFMTGDLPRANGDNRKPVPGYALVDLTLILKNFYKTFEVRASAHNLFDKEYFDPSPANTVPGDYPREGVNYMLEVRYKL
ncbi:Outer membrane vitamin B12 receptor BtuB, partial [hydrothermal vent metagenome]